MTNEEVVQIAKIGAFTVPAASAILVAIIKLSPAWLTARTAEKLRSDDEARKQRDEIRAEKKAVETERDMLKTELDFAEAKYEDLKEQFYRLRENIIESRAVCLQKGHQCSQVFEPIMLKPFVRPIPIEEKKS